MGRSLPRPRDGLVDACEPVSALSFEEHRGASHLKEYLVQMD